MLICILLSYKNRIRERFHPPHISDTSSVLYLFSITSAGGTLLHTPSGVLTKRTRGANLTPRILASLTFAFPSLSSDATRHVIPLCHPVVSNSSTVIFHRFLKKASWQTINNLISKHTRKDNQFNSILTNHEALSHSSTILLLSVIYCLTDSAKLNAVTRLFTTNKTIVHPTYKVPVTSILSASSAIFPMLYQLLTVMVSLLPVFSFYSLGYHR